MADGGHNPVTIMVKKADGTFERKTLDEIKALKKTPAAASSTPSLPPRQPRDSETDEIMKKVSFTLPSTTTNRLRTLIQLRLKEVRTVEQLEEAMVRGEDEGGVGLTDEQASEVLKLLPGATPIATKKPMPLQPQKPRPAPLPMQAPIRPKPKAMLPVPKPMAPPPSAPIKKPSSPPTKPVNPVNKEKIINNFIKSNTEEPYFKTPAESTRPVMRDITTRPTQIGPIGEISVLTLTDFRRLSSNPEEGAMRLKQKFLNVKDESILMYMEALAAWKTSPLYTDYVLAAITNLASGRSLTTLTDAKTIKLEEIKALIGMEQQLTYL